MCRGNRCLHITHPWSVYTNTIAQIAGTPRFVMCEPPVNTISQPPRYNFGIVREGARGSTIEPAALLVECQRQIPVE